MFSYFLFVAAVSCLRITVLSIAVGGRTEGRGEYTRSCETAIDKCVVENAGIMIRAPTSLQSPRGSSALFLSVCT